MKIQWLSALAILILAALLAHAQTPGLMIDKQQETVTHRMFDPAKPPVEMPPFDSEENAECDSDFLVDAKVGGQVRQTDATHATLTINQIEVTLRLHTTIWLPNKVSQHVSDHEEGHRQISEYYYQSVDKVAQRIAASYMGKQVVITGTDLRAKVSKLLQTMCTDIDDEYKREITPEPTQLRYDAVTDHSRNNVVAKDAVAQVLKGITVASTQPAAKPGISPSPLHSQLVQTVAIKSMAHLKAS